MMSCVWTHKRRGDDKGDLLCVCCRPICTAINILGVNMSFVRYRCQGTGSVHITLLVYSMRSTPVLLFHVCVRLLYDTDGIALGETLHCTFFVSLPLRGLHLDLNFSFSRPCWSSSHSVPFIKQVDFKLPIRNFPLAWRS